MRLVNKLIKLGGTTNDKLFRPITRGNGFLCEKGCENMEKEKCLEYYLDARKYSAEEVEKNIEETKKEFPKKKIDVEVTLNPFGMYIITFYFHDKNTIWNKIKIYLRKRRAIMLQESNKTRLKKYSEKEYGKYKTTKTYKPY